MGLKKGSGPESMGNPWGTAFEMQGPRVRRVKKGVPGVMAGPEQTH